MTFDPQAVQALVFDVFGTVVDWRGSIIVEGAHFNRTRGLAVDWGALADAWRAGYQPAMDRVRRGQAEWASIDHLHRQILDDLLPRFGLDHLTEPERRHLNQVWHRLTPWDDVRGGLMRLREQHIVTTLSNGHVALLVALSRQGGLTWDCILSAELAQHYKPDPETYLMVGRLLDLPQDRLMMVAAHSGDLIAARQTGMKTAFVRRPLEFGADGAPDQPDEACDLIVNDLHELADRLVLARPDAV